MSGELLAGTEMDPDLLAALDDGELTQEQLRRLITFEAAQMGLTYDQAVDAAEAGTLARTLLGCDVDLLLRMVAPADAAPAVEGAG